MAGRFQVVLGWVVLGGVLPPLLATARGSTEVFVACAVLRRAVGLGVLMQTNAVLTTARAATCTAVLVGYGVHTSLCGVAAMRVCCMCCCRHVIQLMVLLKLVHHLPVGCCRVGEEQ